MRKKKDILFLCQFFYPEYISSAQLPYQTAQALKGAGYSVGVLCGYPREYLEGTGIPTREEVEGIAIRRLKYIQMDRAGFLGRIINYFSFTLMVLLHLGTLARYHTVVVYSNPPVLPWIASWAKVLFGTRLVFVAYDLYPEVATVTNTLRQGNLICRLMNHINRCVYRRADRVVALSDQMRSYILAHRDIDPGRVAVIPNWYPDAGAPQPARPENPFLPRTQGKLVVSYFGNMGTMQDMDTVLGAIRQLKNREDIFFLFAGHGNKLEQLKQLIQAEGIENISIHGFLQGQDFQDALEVSHCALVTLEKGAAGLCVPSKTYCYMMQGLALLAVMEESDIVRDVADGCGVWVENGQSEKLAQAIEALSRDRQTLAQIQARCRQRYLEQYTPEICLRKYIALFRDLLGSPWGKEL